MKYEGVKTRLHLHFCSLSISLVSLVYPSHFLSFCEVNFLKHAELEPEHENSFWLYFVQLFFGVFLLLLILILFNYPPKSCFNILGRLCLCPTPTV